MVVLKFKGLKWSFIISIIILFFSTQTIFAAQNHVYDEDYLVEELANANETDLNFIYNKCKNDFQEAEIKINNGSLKLDNNNLINFHFNKITCYIKDSHFQSVESNFVFLLYEYNKGNFKHKSKNYHEFKLFIIPIFNLHFPNLNLLSLLDEDDIDLLVSDTGFGGTTDPLKIAANNFIIQFGVITLFQIDQKDKARELLKKIKINKETNLSFISSIQAVGAKGLLAETPNDVIKHYNESITLINEYIQKFESDSSLIWLKLQMIKAIGYQYRKLKKYDESLAFLTNQNIGNFTSNLEPHFLQAAIKVYFDISKLKSGYYHDPSNYGAGFSEARTAVKLLINNIINNKNAIFSTKDLNTYLEENKKLLEHYLTSRAWYNKQLSEDTSISQSDKAKIYWEDFELAFTIIQLLMNNEVDRSLIHLENKILSNNKKTKNNLKKKIKLEEEIQTIYSQLTTIGSNTENNISNQYDAVKKELTKTDKKLNKLYPKFTNFTGTKTANFRNVLYHLNDNEIVFLIYRDSLAEQGYVITAISKAYNQSWTLGPEYYESDIEKIKNYTKSFNSQFPNTSANKIYNQFFGKHIEELKKLFNAEYNNIIIITNNELIKFPYWLLITENNNSVANYKDYSWFSKKYSYSVLPSINSFINLREQKNLKWKIGINYDPTNLEIVKVFNDSHAEKNDFKLKDKIISINNVKVSDVKSVSKELDKITIKEDLIIELLRNNKIITKKLKAYNKNQNLLKLPIKIIEKIKKAKKYDFVGIGNPILSDTKVIAQNTLDNKYSNIFEDYQTRGKINQESLKLLPSLPETKDELLNIQKNFDQNKTLLLLGNDAKEKKVKEINLSNSKFIVFASHALVAGEIDEFNEPGIVLTPPEIVSHEDDGLLTASEIIELDLNNTDLVVLSACNTAASKDDNSIALSGLAKSFFVAGAKSLIVSGWPVETKSAAFLSTNTFKEITTNKDISYSKALQTTINKMIDKNMHPLLWSPFILISD